MRFRLFNKATFRFWRTALMLVLIPAAELGLLLHFFGSLFTVVSVLVSGLLGAFLAHRQGTRCWIELNRQLDGGEMPTVPVLDGILILLAAGLLVLPGLLTSLVGLVLFFPLIRTFIVSYMVLHFNAQRLRTRKQHTPSTPEIIDI